MRFVINIILKAGVFAGLSYLGWLTIMQNGHATRDVKEIISVALLSALIFTGFDLLIKLVSCGLAIFMWVFLGPIVLWVTHLAAPGFLQLHGFWLTVAPGVLLVLVKLPKKRQPAVPSTPAEPLEYTSDPGTPIQPVRLDPGQYHWKD